MVFELKWRLLQSSQQDKNWQRLWSSKAISMKAEEKGSLLKHTSNEPLRLTESCQNFSGINKTE